LSKSPPIVRRALIGAMAAGLAGGGLYTLTRNRPPHRINVRQAGLVGTLFLPADTTDLPAIVSLTGAGGGFFERPAEALAGAGFAVLALATHNAEGRPPTMRLLPVEYVIDAVAWLRRWVQPARGKVVLRGWSRGGELALLAASLSPEVNGVLAYAPRTYVGREQNRPNDFGDPTATAAFTWRGQPLDGEPLPEAMRFNRTNPSLEDMHGIAVERIAGPIMLITGSADTGLAGTTADFSADQAMRRLELFKSPWRRQHDHYPDAGHDIAGPPPYIGHAEGGGTIAGNAAAVAASWPSAIGFLRAAGQV